jgi:hypothetical protein
MKKATLILLAILAAQVATAASVWASAESSSYTVVLAAGGAENTVEISLSADGREYVITSAVPLEVGGQVCQNAPGDGTVLICRAPMIAGFQVNASNGNDSITVTREVQVPVTLRGAAGDDWLVGGAGPDKLIGGVGDDRLIGRAGDDLIFGGPGNDQIFGGPGDDTLLGGTGKDLIAGGPGVNNVRQDPAP